MAMGDLVMKVSLFFTWLFPLGTYHALNPLDPLHMYMTCHSLLSTLTLCELYMTDVMLGHLQERVSEPQKNEKKK